jgi:16S rRNA (guanine527-N7)-methyltransferase
LALSPHISRLERRLRDGIEALALDLPEAAVPQLLAYLAELEQWNAAYNLTAIRDPQQMVTRHLLDSLAVLPYIQGDRIIDVGAGAGLPGLVLAIARPGLQVTTLDSNGKKTRFMRHAVRSLGLANASVAEARAEAFEPDEPFDQVLSRAFASLADFVTGTRELLAPGGQWVAMKGKLESAELSALPPGCRIDATHRLRVPGLSEDRHAVILTAT